MQGRADSVPNDKGAFEFDLAVNSTSAIASIAVIDAFGPWNVEYCTHAVPWLTLV